MADLVIAVLVLVIVIGLVVWLSLGRRAFGPDTGTEDDPKYF